MPNVHDSVLNAGIQGMMWLTKQFWWKPFIQQTHQPQLVQHALLHHILSKNAQTTFGNSHQFRLIKDYQAYRQSIPIHTYEDLRPHIEAQEETKEGCLNVEQPIMYTQTSGTTGKPKYIPVLQSTLKDYKNLQRLLVFAQHQALPSIYHGKILAIASPAIEGKLETGTPFGSTSGLIYQGLPRFVQKKYILPPDVLAIKEYDLKYLLIAAYGLAEPRLSLLASANPSTFLKLLDVIQQNYSKLLDMLANTEDGSFPTGFPFPHVTPRRISALNALRGQEDRITLGTLWPQLQAVATWTGGSCGVLIPKLRSLLPPTTSIVEMGYLSSEFIGSVNVDVQNNRCIPTFHENFFEFVEQDEWEKENPTILTLEEVEVGKRYYVIVTTQQGLYRYFINDIVEVTGFFNRTPTIQFVQKGKGVTNLTGEKLYEHQVICAMESVKKECEAHFDFFMMLADAEHLQYTLYIEHQPLVAPVGPILEKHLARLNIEFEAKRLSERLKPIKVTFLESGTAETYKHHCVTNGQREAQFKLVKLLYTKDCTFPFSNHEIK